MFSNAVVTKVFQTNHKRDNEFFHRLIKFAMCTGIGLSLFHCNLCTSTIFIPSRRELSCIPIPPLPNVNFSCLAIFFLKFFRGPLSPDFFGVLESFLSAQLPEILAIGSIMKGLGIEGLDLNEH